MPTQTKVKRTAKIERKANGWRQVTVRLGGWPREVKTLSVVEEYWYVEFLFKAEGPESMTYSKVVFETADYEKAKAQFDALRVIVD